MSVWWSEMIEARDQGLEANNHRTGLGQPPVAAPYTRIPELVSSLSLHYSNGGVWSIAPSDADETNAAKRANTPVV